MITKSTVRAGFVSVRVVLMTALLLAMSSTLSYADCTAPAAVEGSINYSSGDDYKYCDGTNWIDWGSGGGGGVSWPEDITDATGSVIFTSNSGATNMLSFVSTDESLFLGEGAGDAYTSGTGNTFIGQKAGTLSATASDNTGVGRQAGEKVTGSGNTMFGSYAGTDVLAGASNTLVGALAGADITTENYNTFVGYFAGRTATTANSTFIGHYAGNHVTADNNTFVGYLSGRAATGAGQMTGTDNTFVGYQTGLVNTSGDENTFIGDIAGTANTDGSNNTFVGSAAGLANIGGDLNTFLGASAGSGNDTGNWNTFVGQGAGGNNTGGNANVMIGRWAGRNADTSWNTFIGDYAGEATTGSANTFVGQGAGENTTTGARNIMIGRDAYNLTATTSDYLNIGDAIYGVMDTNGTPAIGDGEASITIDGDLNVVDVNYTGFLVDASDRRLKTNIEELDTDRIKDNLLSLNTYSFTMISDPKERTEFGVMAQELVKVFPELVLTAEDEMKTMSVNYIGLIAPIIETVKILNAENKSLEVKLDKMQTGIWSLLGLIIASLFLQFFFIRGRK